MRGSKRPLSRPVGSALAVIAIVCVSGCAPATPAASPADPAADRQQIEAAANRIWAAVAAGSAAGALAEYAEDAIVLGPGSPMVQGKPAITKAITDTFAAIAFRDVSGKIMDISVSGDLGIETGTYAWTIVPPSGPPAPDKGKYIHVWARSTDRTWKVIRYIINSDSAPPQ